MTLVMVEANMGRRLMDDGLKHEPDGRTVQAAADLGWKVVHIPPLGWDGNAVRMSNVLLPA